MRRHHSRRHRETRGLRSSLPLAQFCQRASFLLVLLVLGYAPLAFGSVPAWWQGWLPLGVMLAALFWLGRIVISAPTSQLVSTLVGPPALLIATYAIVAYSLVEIEPIARREMLLVVSAVLFFFLVLHSVEHRWQITTLAWLLVGLGTLIALYGLGQVIDPQLGVWGTPQYDAYLGRASGPFVRPAYGAAYLLLAFPLALTNALFSRRSYRQKVAMALAALVMAAAVVCSFSPGAWVGGVAAVLVIGLCMMRRSGYKMPALVMGLLTLGIVLVMVLAGWLIVRSPAVAADPQAVAPRPLLWQSALDMGRTRLWLGNGPNMFAWRFPAFRTIQGLPAHADNEYLTLLADYGLAGCLMVVWLMGGFLVEALKILQLRTQRYSSNTLSNRYAFAAGGLASLAALLVQSAISGTVHAPANGFTAMALMAGVLTCGVHARDEDDGGGEQVGRFKQLRLREFDRWILLVPFVFVILLLAWCWVRTYPAAVLRRLADQEKLGLNWAAAERLDLQAWGCDHRSFETAEALGDLAAARATFNLDQRQEFCHRALEWYDRALAINPYMADVIVKLARVQEALGKLELARERYVRAVEFDPNNASYHIELGLFYLRQGERDRAKASFRRAEELGGPDVRARAQLKQPEEPRE